MPTQAAGSGLQMLDLPEDDAGLAWIAARNPGTLLLVPNLQPASITAASLGDQQAQAYLRFRARDFAAHVNPLNFDAFLTFCQNISHASGQGTAQESDEEDDGLLQLFQERAESTAELLLKAAAGGELAALKWALGLTLNSLTLNSGQVDWEDMMDAAARGGHLEVLQLLQRGPDPALWTDECTYLAVPHAACLKWLLAEGCPVHPDVLPGLAEEADLETMKWIKENFTLAPSLWNARVTTAAAARGDVSMMQWLRSLDPPVPWNVECIPAAIKNRHLPMVEWLRSQDPPCPWTAGACLAAADAGDLQMLRWLRAQTPPCPWDFHVCSRLAKRGHLDMLRWARQADPPCPWTAQCTAAAASKGQLQILQWLRTQGCPLNAHASHCAAWAGDLAIIQWLKAQHCPLSRSMYLQAAIKGHSHVLRWLHSNRVSVPPTPIELPAKSVLSTPNLMFLGDKRCPLAPELQDRLIVARRAFCTFHGLLRWSRRAVWDPSRRAHRAFDPLASGQGQSLLIRLSQLPPELINKIAVAAQLQHDLMESAVESSV